MSFGLGQMAQTVWPIGRASSGGFDFSVTNPTDAQASQQRGTVDQTVRCQSVVLKNGLSRMPGDWHVRFSGGGGAVMRCRYPTR